MEEENKNEEVNTDPEAAGVTESVSASEVSEKSQGNKIWIAMIVIFGAVFVAGLVFYLNTDAPDSDTLPGLVVRDADYVLATVNGEEIYQKDLDARLQEASPELLAQGIDMTDIIVRAEIETQLLDDIIGYKLLVQASSDAGTEVSPEEVDALLQGYIEQSGGEEALDAELEKIELTRDSFKGRIAEQLTLQQYISENVEQVEISDEDVTAFYESVVATQEGAPALSEIHEQIEAQLSSDAQQQGIVAFVEALKGNADVVVN